MVLNVQTYCLRDCNNELSTDDSDAEDIEEDVESEDDEDER